MSDPASTPAVGVPGHAARVPHGSTSSKPRLDRTQPYGAVYGDPEACFEQNGKRYDKEGVEL